MAQLPTQSRPRLVKLVRDRIGQFLGDSTVSYGPIRDREQAVQALRAKLLEECGEYLMNPSVGELADVLDVAMALAVHDLYTTWDVVEREAAAKTGERGSFESLVGMYVQTTASARHEGEHAA